MEEKMKNILKMITHEKIILINFVINEKKNDEHLKKQISKYIMKEIHSYLMARDNTKSAFYALNYFFYPSQTLF